MSDENQTEDIRPKAAASVGDWEARRNHYGVTLPSGAVVDIRLPDLPAMAKAGDIPNELLEASVQLQKAIEDKDRSALTTETLVNLEEFMEFLLPEMILQPKITAEDVQTKLPSEDKELLVQFAQRARDLDAVGRHLAGLEKLAEWRRFRGWEDAA